MRTNLTDYRLVLQTTEKKLGVDIIDAFIKGLFLELTSEFDTEDHPMDEHDFGAETITECIEFEPGEVYGSNDFDYTVGFGEMDICLMVKWNTFADRFYETDGYPFLENIGHDISEITFNVFGNEFDLTEWKEAREIVWKMLDYNAQ